MTQIHSYRDGNTARDHRSAGRENGRVWPSAASLSNSEARFLSGPGKPANRQVAVLQDRRADLSAQQRGNTSARDLADTTVAERQAHHRGGDHSWLLRPLIGFAVIAEGVTAFVGMEVLVPSVALAVGLSALVAAAGTGIACVLANRRLNQVRVPVPARVLEGTFVAVLTVLRYASLHVQGVGLSAAAGGAALAALISALALLGIEELLVETHTFSVFASRVLARYWRWRHARAAGRLSRTEAQIEAATEKMRQHFLAFLLKEGATLDEAQHRATSFIRAMADGRRWK